MVLLCLEWWQHSIPSLEGFIPKQSISSKDSSSNTAVSLIIHSLVAAKERVGQHSGWATIWILCFCKCSGQRCLSWCWRPSRVIVHFLKLTNRDFSHAIIFIFKLGSKLHISYIKGYVFESDDDKKKLSAACGSHVFASCCDQLPLSLDVFLVPFLQRYPSFRGCLRY